MKQSATRCRPRRVLENHVAFFAVLQTFQKKAMHELGQLCSVPIRYALNCNKIFFRYRIIPCALFAAGAWSSK